MQFIGPPFTFGLNLINNASGLISPNGAVVAPNGVFWMGYDNFTFITVTYKNYLVAY